jgi:hypothetical protein
MEMKRIQAIVSILLITIFVAACSAPSNIPTLEPQLTGTQAPETPAGTAPVHGESLCSNVYYPVRQGATWSYKSTGGPAGEYSFTDTIAAVSDSSFTLSTEIGTLTNLQDWGCMPEGLVALQLGGAPTAMLDSQGIQLTLNAINTSGVVFPRQINAGDQWQHTLDVAGTVRAANEEGQASGNVQMDFSAIGNERVSVPAGTFDAMKIQVDTTLNLNATYGGVTLPVAFSVSHMYWFASGTGWVKATGTGTILATSFSETTELQSYNIP